MNKTASKLFLHAWPGVRVPAVALLVILLVSVAGFSAPNPAQHHKPLPTGKLDGTVLGPDGKPAAKARVIAQSSDGSHPHSAKADSQGHFQVTCTAGPVDVRAHAGDNWSEWVRNVRVRAGETTSITIRITENSKTTTEKPSSPPQ